MSTPLLQRVHRRCEKGHCMGLVGLDGCSAKAQVCQGALLVERGRRAQVCGPWQAVMLRPHPSYHSISMCAASLHECRRAQMSP